MWIVQPFTLPAVVVWAPRQPQEYINAPSRSLVLTERYTGMPSGRPRWAVIAASLPAPCARYVAAPPESAFRHAPSGWAGGGCGACGWVPCPPMRYAAGAVTAVTP